MHALLTKIGLTAVEKIIEAKLAGLHIQQPPVATDQTPILSRLEAIERMQQQSMQRAAYTSNLLSWAAQGGMPNLFARLAPGGDLSEKWAAFAQQYPNATAAYDNGDTEGTKAFVKLFLYENPGISQQAATPSAAGGFAAPADPNQYTPQMFIRETDELDSKFSQGLISEADRTKGYAAANAKLAALQSQTR